LIRTNFNETLLKEIIFKRLNETIKTSNFDMILHMRVGDVMVIGKLDWHIDKMDAKDVYCKYNDNNWWSNIINYINCKKYKNYIY
jgi:hypothetical protein